jgi:hypothetical protein
MAAKAPTKKDPAAVALGRKGGKKGGPARAAKLTPKQRSASARKAVLARWEKAKAKRPHSRDESENEGHAGDGYIRQRCFGLVEADQRNRQPKRDPSTFGSTGTDNLP